MKRWGWLALAVLLAVGLLALVLGGGAGGGELHVSGVLHVNVNVSDFERSRAFYERLGAQVIMEVDTVGEDDVAAAVGMDTSYVVEGALMAMPDGSVIDLLEWSVPRDDTPPYAGLNHLGIARIALTTTDIEADMAHLRGLGIEFLAEQPAAVPDPLGGTTRFICFRDPDGTVLELVEMGTAMGWLQRAAKAAGG